MAKKSKFMRYEKPGIKTEDGGTTIKEEPMEDLTMVVEGNCNESGKRLHGDSASVCSEGGNGRTQGAQGFDAPSSESEEMCFKAEIEDVYVKEEALEDLSTTLAGHCEGDEERLRVDASSLRTKEEASGDPGSKGTKDSSETVNTEDQIATEDQALTSIKEIEQEDHGQSFRTPRNPPKRARKSEDSPANEAVKCMKSLTQIVSAKDENSAFGEFVANKMKSCNRPRMEISLAQRYINDILFRLDMGLLSGDIQSMYKSHTYPTYIPSYSPLADSLQFSGHPSPIQPCSPVPTISGSPVPPQQSQFSGHPSPIQPCSPVPTVSGSPVPPQQSQFSGHPSIEPCSPVPTVSGSPVPPQQSQSLARTLNNPFNFLDL